VWRLKAAEATSNDLYSEAAVVHARLHIDARIPQTIERCGTIGALRISCDGRPPGCQCSQERVTVRNGFIAGKPNPSLDAPGRPHRRCGD
jgi:hypothetical protein